MPMSVANHASHDLQSTNCKWSKGRAEKGNGAAVENSGPGFCLENSMEENIEIPKMASTSTSTSSCGCDLPGIESWEAHRKAKLHVKGMDV
jgi:hypothetical protein